MELRERILELGQKGFLPREVEGGASKRVDAAIATLCKRGLLHRAKISHRHVRYFVDPKKAMEYEAAHRGAVTDGVSIKHYGRAPWSKDTPAIVSDHVKVVVCPSPPEFGLAAKLKRAA